MPPPLNPKARAVMVPGLLPVVINTITRHRSILGVQLDRALCCQVLHLAGLSLFSHLARAVFGIFLFRASAISPVASPLGGCGTFCTSVVKERYFSASDPLLAGFRLGVLRFGLQ